MADEFGGANIGFGQGANPLGYFGRLINDFTGKTSSNQFNAVEAEKARLFNSAEAEKQREWETMMSNTAYQRAKDDMLAAGINPASLGGNGSSSPASTPSGASAQGVAARDGSGNGSLIGSVVSAIIGGIGTAAKNSIARSALSNKEGYLDLKKIETQSKVALNAAKKVDMESNSALKKAKDFREREYHKFRLDGTAMHSDLEEQRFYNTQLKNILLKQRIKRYG